MENGRGGGSRGGKERNTGKVQGYCVIFECHQRYGICFGWKTEHYHYQIRYLFRLKDGTLPLPDTHTHTHTHIHTHTHTHTHTHQVKGILLHTGRSILSVSSGTHIHTQKKKDEKYAAARIPFFFPVFFQKNGLHHKKRKKNAWRQDWHESLRAVVRRQIHPTWRPDVRCDN
jgi:hypothetical protein